MTTKTDLAKTFEKPWYKSKKFIAFLLMELLLYSLALVTLIFQDDVGWPLAAFMFGIIVSMGAMALAFNGRQAQLDAYVRGMAMVGKSIQIGSTNEHRTLRTYPESLSDAAIAGDYDSAMSDLGVDYLDDGYAPKEDEEKEI